MILLMMCVVVVLWLVRCVVNKKLMHCLHYSDFVVAAAGGGVCHFCCVGLYSNDEYDDEWSMGY